MTDHPSSGRIFKMGQPIYLLCCHGGSLSFERHLVRMYEIPSAFFPVLKTTSVSPPPLMISLISFFADCSFFPRGL